MGWADLIGNSETITVPWTGGRTVVRGDRTFRLRGRTPPEFGWHQFSIDGSRNTRWTGAGETDFTYGEGRKVVTGYLVGDRIILDGTGANVAVEEIFDQTERVFLVPQGQDRFARASCAVAEDGRLIYLQPAFPKGPEWQVMAVFQDQGEDISQIPDVTPALDLAFRFESWMRAEAIERRRIEEERRLEELAEAERQRQLAELRRQIGTAQGRRELAKVDFPAAARAALAFSGAEYLDSRVGRAEHQMVVQFRFQGRRFECVCHAETLRIIDSGICLTDHATGERGDTRFTLETLPDVIEQSGQRLHRYRHFDDEEW